MIKMHSIIEIKAKENKIDICSYYENPNICHLSLSLSLSLSTYLCIYVIYIKQGAIPKGMGAKCMGHTEKPPLNHSDSTVSSEIWGLKK
jgi:hypothetical protein